ncbi:hypothetical protein [Variovorax sp. J31P207]|uniref:hypothetical protein n=1 Tax=Variovorax sp. J31P207 TaxID=3053510 RepID=UPI0025775383|nr:hypothetical protein [Variovorax sp. J31P207]MDM0071457.1 hypothetical protein [Variovorax sp. J31P207]
MPTGEWDAPYLAVASDWLPHIDPKEVLHAERIGQAWKSIAAAGLVYEAVVLFDDDPLTSSAARLLMTVRVNDFHAGSNQKMGDPSFLREDLGHGFYTQAKKGQPSLESMWVDLPRDRGHLVGIARPRLRASNPDAGAWLDQEKEAIDESLARLEVMKAHAFFREVV